MNEKKQNHFIYRRIFPEVKSLFERKEKTIDEIFKNALFVIDTNSLLAPFNIGKENLDQIKSVYEKLINENRLYIPEHVLREFARNRSVKISDLYSEIDKLLSSLPNIKSFQYPILAELTAYEKMESARKNIQDNIKKYKESLNEIKSGITNWNWSDPVTSMYQEIFSEKIIIDLKEKEDDLIKEYEDRINNDIPPGNKDKNKEFNAIGDFLIWKTILELGKKEKKDIIFVSNDEKNDWLLIGNKKSISTKFELVDEFYRHTNGNHFISMTISDFLEKQGLDVEFEITLDDLDSIFGNEEGKNGDFRDSVIDDLEEIYVKFTKFLKETEGVIEDDTYLDSSIDIAIDHFIKNYSREFHNTGWWEDYFDYFFLFSKWLKEIKSLNYQIIFQSHRMKKDTRTETIKMKALMQEYINKYTEFRLSY